jgi:hypothetical protein
MIFDNSVCIRGNGGPKLPSFTDITIKVICWCINAPWHPMSTYELILIWITCE